MVEAHLAGGHHHRARLDRTMLGKTGQLTVAESVRGIALSGTSPQWWLPGSICMAPFSSSTSSRATHAVTNAPWTQRPASSPSPGASRSWSARSARRLDQELVLPEPNRRPVEQRGGDSASRGSVAKAARSGSAHQALSIFSRSRSVGSNGRLSVGARPRSYTPTDPASRGAEPLHLLAI